MAVNTLIGFGILLACCLLEVSSRPNNESTKIELPLDEAQEQDSTKEERSITFTKDHSATEYNINTRDIIKKIQAINDRLTKPHRQQLNYNKLPEVPGSYSIDRDTLEKIQQIIDSAKNKPLAESEKQHENNYLNEDPDNFRREHSKALPIISNGFNQLSMSPYPYIMNMPVVVMPSPNNMRYTNDDLNSIQSSATYQSRQEQPFPFPSFPSFPSNFQWPFQFQWPFASLFPLIVKDPLVALQQGGGWNNFFEYGQNADVCTRKQKSFDNEVTNNDNNNEISKLLDIITSYKNNMAGKNVAEEKRDESVDPVTETSSREARALKKRTIANNAPAQKIETSRKAQKIYVAKPVLVTNKPPKKVYIEEDPEDTKSSAADGDLRIPFGGFDWFGNKKPVAPSPGFFINRLRVRKGGVAIAGPGGVATAGRGGTAIVGPGGLAYTQPGGLAVAGPSARVFALSSETDLNSLITRLRQLNNTSVPINQQIREGKLVATGPVIYYHPNEQTASTQYLPFYGGAKGQYLEVKKDNSGTVVSEKIVAEENISGENVIKNSSGNVLSRVLAANLQTLKTLSSNLIRLNNLGRKLGYLTDNDVTKFKSQLASLGEAASNTIKLVEEVGDDVLALFKKETTLKRYDDTGDADDDDVGEEGVSIDNPDEPFDDMGNGRTIAEARPIGLAVIGESGLAASRPMGTAVAQSGVALARPVATAIAGLDPIALGIEFNLNQAHRYKSRRPNH